jgi:hypothetical protein
VLKILVDNGSQAEIIFLSTFKKMGYDKKQLKEPMKSLYGFGGKRIEPVGVVTLPVAFGTQKKPHTEYITFDVVDMLYPYNAIFDRGLLNTFEAALHSTYLYLKVPTTFRVIIVFDSQKEARNIERCFALGYKNMHFLREDANQPEQSSPKQEILVEFKKAIEAEGDFTRLPLDPRVPDRIVCIRAEISLEEQAKLLQFLDKNNDIFAWSTFDLIEASREVIEHKLQVNPNTKPKKQKLRKMSEKKIEAARAEVQHLLDAWFISEVTYPHWLANVVMVCKKSGKWRMCTNFTDLIVRGSKRSNFRKNTFKFKIQLFVLTKNLTKQLNLIAQNVFKLDDSQRKTLRG